MLKKALTTTVLATVLLTSSISANDTTTQGFSGSTAKVETIGAFHNIPTQGLNNQELNVVGEGWASNKAKKWIRKQIKIMRKKGFSTWAIQEILNVHQAY